MLNREVVEDIIPITGYLSLKGMQFHLAALKY